jgi:hypothetical protein
MTLLQFCLRVVVSSVIGIGITMIVVLGLHLLIDGVWLLKYETRLVTRIFIAGVAMIVVGVALAIKLLPLM